MITRYFSNGARLGVQLIALLIRERRRGKEDRECDCIDGPTAWDWCRQCERLFGAEGVAWESQGGANLYDRSNLCGGCRLGWSAALLPPAHPPNKTKQAKVPYSDVFMKSDISFLEEKNSCS